MLKAPTAGAFLNLWSTKGQETIFFFEQLAPVDQLLGHHCDLQDNVLIWIKGLYIRLPYHIFHS